MALGKIWAKVGKWRLPGRENQPERVQNSAVAVETGDETASMVAVEPRRNDQALAGEAFNLLIAQLEGINENLGKHADQQQQLLERMNKLPEILASLPETIQNQSQLTDAVCNEMSRRQLKEAQFLEAVERIPEETAKQSNTLESMSRKLSVAADANVQVSENFNRFNDTLGKLNTNSVSQNEGIEQMSKTFASSDRYLKYIITRQNNRFMWMFIVSLGICLVVIISFVVTIALMRGK
jgi:chromosome segregation ATPase